MPCLQDRPEALGWMRVAGDVFREPPAAAQLAVLFGGGVHGSKKTVDCRVCTRARGCGVRIATTWDALATTATLTLLAIRKFVTAYCAVWLWCNLQRSSGGWRWLCLIGAFGIPGALLPLLGASHNFTAVSTGSCKLRTVADHPVQA